MQRFFTIVLIVDLIILNLALFFLWRLQPIASTPSTSDSCGSVCQQYINQKIAQIPTITPIPTATPSASLIVASLPIPKAKTSTQTQTSYLPIPGNGSVALPTWTNIPTTEFYFDKADYPGLVAIYFEANINLLNGNGQAFVRLYDSTNNIGVQGSDLQSNQQASSSYASGSLNFWAGKNLIRVQAKSLTADTAVYTSGRLKIITKN